MSRQLDWDTYRYVLDDPTLDRLAFEARMLEDVELALAVADAMSHIDALRAASFITNPANGSPAARPAMNSAVVSGWHWSSLAALAAAILLAVAAMNYQFVPRSAGNNAKAHASEQRLAETWLAIGKLELVDVSSNLVDVSSNFDATTEEPVVVGTAVADSAELVTAEATSESDWLMEAAREFYAQGGAS